MYVSKVNLLDELAKDYLDHVYLET